MEHAQSDEHFHGNFEKELQNKYNFQSLKTNWHNMNTNNMTHSIVQGLSQAPFLYISSENVKWVQGCTETHKHACKYSTSGKIRACTVLISLKINTWHENLYSIMLMSWHWGGRSMTDDVLLCIFLSMYAFTILAMRFIVIKN